MELEKHMQRKVGKVRIDTMMRTMPRYPSPPIIPDPGKWYKEPCIAAIGHYHHGLDHLEQAEEMKHVAAYHCIEESGRPVEDLYGAVISAVGTTYGRHLYRYKDAGLSDDDFLPMMFFDACFLVHCMVWYTDRSGKMDVSLSKFFEHNYQPVRLVVFGLWLISQRTVFFSHTKPTNGTFSHGL